MEGRSIFFDDLKGLLIFFVILGHVISICKSGEGVNSPLYVYIYSFHMPLFVCISGFFSLSSYRRSGMEMFTIRFKRLILPLLFYSSIICILYFISGASELENRNVLHKVYNIYVSYWYLINIFILTCLYWLCFRSVKFGVLLSLIYISFLLYYEYLPGYILKDCQIIRLAPIFGIGILCKNKIEGSSDIKKLFPIIMFSFLLALLNRQLFGENIFCYSIYIRIIDGIACSIAFFSLFSFFYFFSKKWIKSSFLTLVGRNSLAFYLVHLVYIRMLSYFDVVPLFSYLNIAVWTLGISIITGITIIMIKKIVSQRYLYLFGL